jgi:hypothetical protein
VATGLNFPDALAGGAHIGTAGGPLLLSLPDALPLSVEHYLQANNTSISGGWIYGGSDVVSDDVLMQVERDIT